MPAKNIVEIGARHEPRLLPEDEAALRPTLERLSAILEKRGHYDAVADAVAGIGPGAASLADELVLTPPDVAEDEPPRDDGQESDGIPLAMGKAMERIGPPAVPHLLHLLKHRDPRVRGGAVDALTSIYSGDFPLFGGERRQAPREVIEAVQPLMGDSDERVRASAADAVYWWKEGRAGDGERHEQDLI